MKNQTKVVVLMEKLLLHIENSVAWLTINRAEKRNAIDYEVIELFEEKLTEIESREDVKILVVTGQGTEAFCSGGDLSVFHNIHKKDDAKSMLEKMAKVLQMLFFFPKPTVAFLNGTAVGGGCEIATACDFRIASNKNIKLGFIQGRLGITTGWGGATYLFERLDRKRAFELLLTAKSFDVEEAIRLGFIQDIYSESLFHSWLEEMTKQPLGVILAYKKRFLESINKERIYSRVQEEINECSLLWETPEHEEAVQRFMNK